MFRKHVFSSEFLVQKLPIHDRIFNNSKKFNLASVFQRTEIQNIWIDLFIFKSEKRKKGCYFQLQAKKNRTRTCPFSWRVISLCVFIAGEFLHKE